MTRSPSPPGIRPQIPRTVWALGLVSLFMDVSSEMIHSLLPLFLTGTLGASVLLVGIIDGIAESTAAISKVFSGYLSDKIGRRKPLLIFGYGLGAFSKPFFAMAGGPMLVLAARFADRIGKGIRGAPRDALIADVAPPGIRGRSYGLRQAMDTVGSFVGPLLAIGLMVLFASDIRAVFWAAVIPGVIATLCVVYGVRDSTSEIEARKSAAPPISLSAIGRFTPAFWTVAAIGIIFTLARFSEAFLILKASEEGLPLVLAPLVLVVMNVVYSVCAYPAGAASDRLQAFHLLLMGLGALIAADLCLAFAPGLTGAFLGIALWGLHMALTQGLFSKLVADNAPPELRGSAFGLFNLSTGVAMLLSSIVAGLVWDKAGSSATFVAGAGFAAAAALIVLAARKRLHRPHQPQA